MRYSPDDTIAAISTPSGEGGIGIVRLSGKKALSIADEIFVPKSKSKVILSKAKTYTMHYGHIIRETLAKREIVDEVLVTVMRAPGSYTKEDVVEINCHGGIVPLRKVLDLVVSSGARFAQPGEFTKRAFINGRIDLTQAEAVLDVIRAKTESSMRVALGQLEGGLSDRVRHLKKSLIRVLGEIEARIDFSEEDIELMPVENLSRELAARLREIKKLADEAWKGMIFKEGILCVICGKPNVGKSSLMNAFLRRNRVIVTPVAGTTRDAIEEVINLNGIPVRVVDTAGISRAKDIVEKHGIQKSKSYIKMADLVLFMLDAASPWSKADKNIFDSIKNKNVIIIANKCDLVKKLDLNGVKILLSSPAVEVSLLKKKNLDRIESAILQKIHSGRLPHPEAAFVTNLRQKKDLVSAAKCVKKALDFLQKKQTLSPEIVSSELREGVRFLGSVLGDTVEPDILDRIFSRFCIGK